jgi:hypothetical protein
MPGEGPNARIANEQKQQSMIKGNRTFLMASISLSPFSQQTREFRKKF